MENQDYFSDFERYLLTEKRVSHNTFDAYKRDMQQFYEFLEKNQLSVLSAQQNDLRLFVHHLHDTHLSAQSMVRKISTLKVFFNFLAQKYNITNHARQLIIPKIEKKLPQFLSEDHIDQLLEQAQKKTGLQDQRNFVMLYLLYATGMRISELLELHRDDLNFTDQTIKIRGKGGKERLLPLPDGAYKTLTNYFDTIYPQLLKKTKIQKTTLLFPTYYQETLRAMTRQSFWSYLKQIATQAGLSDVISPHQIRHSLATHLLNKGAHLRSLQLLLGHEHLKTVQIYTHVETAHLRKIYDAKHPRA